MAKNDKKKPVVKKSEKKQTAAKSKAKPTSKPKPKAAGKPVAKTVKSIPGNKEKTKPEVKAKSVVSKSGPSNKTESPKRSTPETKTSQTSKPMPAKPMATVKGILSSSFENKKTVTKTNLKPETPPSTNGKTRYSDKELAEFKVLIDEKLDAARKELNYLQEQIVEMNENNSDIQGSDWFDDSSIHSEVELLNNMAIRQRQFIQNLENALIRIENKTYGICTVTGNLIDKKRLLLVPHATKSIEAKHIEQSTMVPDINQVTPDERVLRRAAEGKTAKKSPVKKSKSKGGARDFEDEDGEESMEAPVEEMDMSVELDD